MQRYNRFFKKPRKKIHIIVLKKNSIIYIESRSMYYRSDINKDNTIISGSTINLGYSEIAPLYNGVKNSRYIFNIDFSNLQEKYNLGLISTDTTHYLNFCISENTIYPCESNNSEFTLYELEDNWVEGCGVDENDNTICNDFGLINYNISHSPSNWDFTDTINVSGTTISGVTWSNDGGYNVSNDITTTRLLCDENCLLSFNISEFVNNLLLNSGTTQGFGIKYTNEEYNNSYNKLSLYTRHTNTFYKPFLETFDAKSIKDNRSSFPIGKSSRLYFFTNIGNLDENPTVTIYNNLGDIINTLTSSQYGNGIYYVEFTLLENIKKCTMWKDVWSNIKYNRLDLPNVNMRFNLIPISEYFDFGYKNDNTLLTVNVMNLKDYEKILMGVKLNIDLLIRKQFEKTTNEVIDSVKYRLSNDEMSCCGGTTIWDELNYINCNYSFQLDTSWLSIGKWNLDIMMENKSEIIIKEKIRSFTII